MNFSSFAPFGVVLCVALIYGGMIFRRQMLPRPTQPQE
jgi:hypothetical protein